MYRVALTTKTKGILSCNFKTKEEVDNYILITDEKYKVKEAIILDKITKKREHIKF